MRAAEAGTGARPVLAAAGPTRLTHTANTRSPRFSSGSEATDENCCICDEFVPDRVLTCGHSFCAACIEKWWVTGEWDDKTAVAAVPPRANAFIPSPPRQARGVRGPAQLPALPRRRPRWLRGLGGGERQQRGRGQRLCRLFRRRLPRRARLTEEQRRASCARLICLCPDARGDQEDSGAGVKGSLLSDVDVEVSRWATEHNTVPNIDLIAALQCHRPHRVETLLSRCTINGETWRAAGADGCAGGCRWCNRGRAGSDSCCSFFPISFQSLASRIDTIFGECIVLSMFQLIQALRGRERRTRVDGARSPEMTSWVVLAPSAPRCLTVATASTVL